MGFSIENTFHISESNFNLIPFSVLFFSSILQHVFRLPNNHNWQSVADRINELEKQQHKQQQAIHDHNKQHYTYLDPSKTHRVPNPTLKAFQKNAIQSYFERQQQQQQSIRLSRNHHGNSGGSKSDELTKMKSIGGSEMSKSNGNIAPRPQSLNLSIATSAISLPTTPSSAVSSASSSAGSQRSSISAWPNVSPTTNPSIMIGSKASDGMMMKNANDIAKMNMKNSAMSSAAALSEKQLFAGSKGNNSKSQSISKNLFTSFCEIKTENYPSSKAHEGIAADNNGANKTNSTPPPLPRKSSVLRRYLCWFKASIFMQLILAALTVHSAIDSSVDCWRLRLRTFFCALQFSVCLTPSGWLITNKLNTRRSNKNLFYNRLTMNALRSVVRTV